MEARVRSARSSAVAKGSTKELEAFELAVQGSSAVFAKSLTFIDTFLSGSIVMVSYYKMTRGAGARLAENNGWDDVREKNDSSVNPHYYEALNFAALSLDGFGVPWYGNYSVTLRTDRIELRTSVFEQNPIVFNERYRVSSSKPPPFGFRAIWQSRAALAVAKLHSQIQSGTKPEQFPEILLEAGKSAADTDFIEAHIYGPLVPEAVSRVIGPNPTDDLEQMIWKRLKMRLDALGAEWAEV